MYKNIIIATLLVLFLTPLQTHASTIMEEIRAQEWFIRDQALKRNKEWMEDVRAGNHGLGMPTTDIDMGEDPAFGYIHEIRLDLIDKLYAERILQCYEWEDRRELPRGAYCHADVSPEVKQFVNSN